MAFDQRVLRLATPGDYLRENPEQQVATPPLSSWGSGGYAGSRLERCTVRGPVIIGAGCTITDCFIGPYAAISDGVVVEHAEIENSIILDGSRICHLNARMADSLIGKNCVIGRRPSMRA